MNRKLLALSVAAALAVPAVAAAENTGPTIYGRLHLSINQLDNGDDKSTNLSSHSSRLGFKGAHDLAEGVEGIYQVESGINGDEGGGELATRNTFAGLKTGFGTLRAGFFDTPVKNIVSTVDLFGDQIGDYDNLSRRAYTGDVHFDQRQRNSIAYTTPSFGGVTGDLHYSTNVDSGGDGEDDMTSLSAAVTYKNKEMYVSLGYQQYGDDVAPGFEPDAIRLGAYYDIGPVRIAGFAQLASDDPTLGDSEAFGLGARYKFGDFAVKAQYATIDADTDNRGADLIAVGGEYKVGKNLTSYLVYSQVSNDDASTLRPWRDVGDDSLGGLAGEDASGVALGMIYNF